MGSVKKPCTCRCGKEPKIKPVFGFGYMVQCGCGSESWVKQNKSVAIDNWNLNRQENI